MPIKSHFQKILGSLSALQSDIVADLERKRLNANQDRARSKILPQLLAIMTDGNAERYSRQLDSEAYHLRLSNFDLVLERFRDMGDSLQFCKDGICVAHWTHGANSLITAHPEGQDILNQSDAFLPEDVDYFLANINNAVINITDFHTTPWANGTVKDPVGAIMFVEQFEKTDLGKSMVLKCFPNLLRQKLSDDLSL